jgi:hypothetical protein
MAKGEQVKARMDLLLQERQRAARLGDLRRDTLRRVDFIRRKAVIEYREVYGVIREFFKEFLERRYEFTITELRKELKKVYISNSTRLIIAGILERLEAAEYATVHYTREDLVKILDDFKQAVEELVKVHTGAKPFFERLRMFLFKDPEPQTIIAELPVAEGNDAYHVRIYTIIEQCYIALDRHNLAKAKAAYDALLQEYGLLDDGRKAQYYPVIEQTYRDLLHRAEMLK